MTEQSCLVSRALISKAADCPPFLTATPFQDVFFPSLDNNVILGVRCLCHEEKNTIHCIDRRQYHSLQNVSKPLGFSTEVVNSPLYPHLLFPIKNSCSVLFLNSF